MTNEEILKGLRERDKKTYTYVYNTCYKSVTNNLSRFIGESNISSANDYFHEAFIKLIARSKTLKSASGICGYLFIIARHIFFVRLKINPIKNQQEEDILKLFPDDQDNMLEKLLKKDNIEKIKKILEMLLNNRPTCKEFITDIYIRKFSVEDIKDKYGYSEGTTKNKKYRCLRYLYKDYKEFLGNQT